MSDLNRRYVNSWRWHTQIAERLWMRGTLFPPLAGVLKKLLTEETLGFKDVQRRLRIPARLALFLLANLDRGNLLIEKEGRRTDSSAVWRLRSEVEESKVFMPAAYARAIKLRPSPALLYGQRFITAESADARAALINRVAAEAGPRVVFLGDDDLVSLWAASINPELQITVVEIDRNLGEVISTVAEEFQLPVVVLSVDLAQDLPESLVGNFDVFVADPYPTPDASFELMFISQGGRLLGKSGEERGIVTWAPSHKAPGFGEILRQGLLGAGFWLHEEIFEACEYEMIKGEFTTLEDSWLRCFGGERNAISHSKGYLVCSPPNHEKISSVRSFHFSLSRWVSAVLRHDLIARTSGGLGLNASDLMRAPASEAWRDVLAKVGSIRAAIDLRAIVSDLLGSLSLGEEVCLALQEGRIAFAASSASKVLGFDVRAELELLRGASTYGPGLQFTQMNAIEELYLVARLYESYYRPVSLLEWRE